MPRQKSRLPIRHKPEPPRPISLNIHDTTVPLLSRLVAKTQKCPADIVDTALFIYEAYVNTLTPLPKPALPPPSITRGPTHIAPLIKHAVKRLKKGSRHVSK